MAYGSHLLFLSMAIQQRVKPFLTYRQSPSALAIITGSIDKLPNMCHSV